MSQLFDDLFQGLSEAIDISNGKIQGKKTVYKLPPLPNYSCEELREIRMRLKMSQSSFAEVLGITKKAVEAWESGRSRPNGSALRLIELLRTEQWKPFDEIKK